MTDLYRVVGNPIKHSKSPQIHSSFAEQTGQDLRYEAQLIAEGEFEADVGAFFADGGKGMNVTVPFKQEAFEFADQLSERARLAGAVNTLAVDTQGQILGENTDGLGLVRDLCVNQGASLTGKRILVLGAGGAVRGVLQPLLAEQPSLLVIANRTAAKARALATDFQHLGPVIGGGYEDLEGTFDLIINGTSASLQGDLPPLSGDLLAPGGWCYDMMYGAEPTPFMRWAREQQAGKVMDGLGMLVEQAAESFRIWRGVQPQTAEVIAAIRQQLG